MHGIVPNFYEYAQMSLYFLMQDSLRYLVQDSLTNYTQMILDACVAILKMSEDFIWGEDVITTPYR